MIFTLDKVPYSIGSLMVSSNNIEYNFKYNSIFMLLKTIM